DLTYVVDATLCKDINVGCGVVFVNYDGKNKHQTVVGDQAVIGTETDIVSPVTTGDHAVTSAGSTITEDVPLDCLL
ncbi:bifunctional UDP-N-acetylglucosamine diphosphorylase/glucosamine-1-phosphate N-acetyltransferase GlmU, partial [Enterococcus faecalis]|nr:bifunctional UDP-N-acetylglucosamine diphosphorylase/glucosamine-1-phosphate N-acetyltransferase GlmU [Enterococcus faecalis]